MSEILPSSYAYSSVNDTTRWLAYFDLLGTRDRTKYDRHAEVFKVYRQALAKAEQLGKRIPMAKPVWFSDTFVFYTEGEETSQLGFLSLLAQEFAYYLIRSKIPVRGAIAHGLVYADHNAGVIFGDALGEAYEFAESQDWLGLILCPSAARHINLPWPENWRFQYRLCPVPLSHMPHIRSEPMYVAELGEGRHYNGVNQLIPVLREMQSSIVEPRVARKYKNTIEFLQSLSPAMPTTIAESPS
jgi:hypothetical protein